MKISTEKISPFQWQILVWIIIYLTIFLSLLSMDPLLQSLVYAFISIISYAVIIYGNISLLYPRLYGKKHFAAYAIAAALLIAGAGFARTVLSQAVYNRYFAAKHYPLSTKDVLYHSFACIVVFVLSFIFRIALDWFSLKQQTRLMLEQKSIAELNLLKSQVQPHFLFNTLNNIYYEAYREAPRTALLIGRLSDIMRYFVDDSPREKLPLATEISFLENYIALEKIRIRHGVDVSFLKDCDPDTSIPPMLLMTLVENIFKHGIDRSAPGNSVSLSLSRENGYLLFQTRNPVYPPDPGISSQGSGLLNLEKRLTLLYGNNFELKTFKSDAYFLASLKIPIA